LAFGPAATWPFVSSEPAHPPKFCVEILVFRTNFNGDISGSRLFLLLPAAQITAV
jgi:hypothetical protein